MAPMTGGGWTWEWIALGVMVLAALLLAAALVGFAIRQRGLAGRAEASCGRCGYDVRGLPTFFCPECGSDLREVGISSGSPRRVMGLLILAIVASRRRMLVWTLAVVAMTLLVMFGALAMVIRYNVEPVAEVTLEPASKAYRVMAVSSGNVRRASGWLNARADKIVGKEFLVWLGSPEGVVDYNTELRVDLQTWSYGVYHWVGGRSATPPVAGFGRAELERFFAERKIDTKRAEVAAELDSLMKVIDDSRAKLVNQAAERAANFRVVSSVDKTQAGYGGTGPAGPPTIGLGGAIWLLAMVGVVVGQMWRFRDGGVGTDIGARPSTQLSPGVPGEGGRVARTVTVLFSDIKDYTARTAAAGRAGAIELVRRHRELAGPVIRQRRGAIVKTMGDGLLVTFESATDAVLAGLEVQAAVAAHNGAAGAGEEFQLRIAVATGEVIVEAGDVYGETVNLASRLQGVAGAGQVVLSGVTASLVNAREVGVEANGEVRLVGFASPVTVFVARVADGVAG
ncbi:MAG: Adenylate cyclase [Phycisphaerales bacterium]|nr:Adenylate cyclase [Phycisphaerales bacterium]